jgi:hypothetical protein
MDAAFTPGEKALQTDTCLRAKGRSTIWNSILLMTTVDVQVIDFAVYAI